MEVQGMEKLLTTQEVADYLGLTRRTIYTYIESKTLPAVKIGKEWRVKESELQAFIREGGLNMEGLKQLEPIGIKDMEDVYRLLEHIVEDAQGLPKEMMAQIIEKRFAEVLSDLQSAKIKERKKH